MKVLKNCKFVFLVVIVIFLTNVCFGQGRFQQLEEQFLTIVEQFRSNSQALTSAHVINLINNFDKYASSANLEAIEKFSIPYYTGYLHYINAALSNGNEQMYLNAKTKFTEAYNKYENVIRLPEKRVFSKYMLAWCSFRQYLAVPGFRTINLLHTAIQELNETDKESNSDFLTHDIYFLRGLCYYLSAYEQLQDKINNNTVTLQPNDVEQAVANFSQINAGDNDINRLASYYLSAAKILKAQYFAVHNLLNETGFTFTRESVLADLRDAQSLLATDNRFNATTKLAYNLAYLSEHAFTKTGFEQRNLLMTSVEQQYHPLLFYYSNFLNSLAGGQVQQNPPNQDQTHNAEYGFLQDLQGYMSYLVAGRGVDDNWFNSGSTQDWRSDYIRALSNLFRKELGVIRNTQVNLNIDTNHLMPHYRIRNRFLDIYWQLKRNFQNDGFNVNSLNEIELLIRNMPDILDQHFRTAFGTQPQMQLIKQYAAYILTLAEKNPRLYPAAYLCYAFLSQSNYETEKTTLLKAYCQLKSGNNDAVLQLLADTFINTFTSEANKTEAIFYRAKAWRARTGLLFEQNEITELDRIKEHHPAAGYAVAYEAYNEVRDRNLLNIAGTQSCRDALNRFPDICTACENLGYITVGNPPLNLAGDEDVRFGALENLMTNYVATEKSKLLDYWLVFSLPVIKPKPTDRNIQACQIDGPKEFYLANEIQVTLNFINNGSTCKIAINDASGGCKIDSTNRQTYAASVFALRPYRIIIAKEGFYPAIIDTMFKTNGENLSINFDQALTVNERTPQAKEKGKDLIVDRENNFLIASKNDKPTLQIYDINNYQTISGDNANYLGLAQSGNSYYVINRSTNDIKTFSASDKDLKEINGFDKNKLDTPASIDSKGNLLLIANSGNNTIVKYNTQSRASEVSQPISNGKIEGVLAIGDKLFITDWIENKIYFTNVYENFTTTQFDTVSIQKARLDGMASPYKISKYGDDYFAVSDIISGKLFLFHKSGEYLNYTFNTSGIINPTIINRTSDNKLTVYHANGETEFQLTPALSYNYSPRCDDIRINAQQALGSASRFCNWVY